MTLGPRPWSQNPALVQLLGLCPLLAVTTTLVAGVSLGIVTTLVMALTGAATAALRKLIPQPLRILAVVLIISTAVTAVHLALNAYFYPLYLMLGIYVPLMATNCLVLERADGYARTHPLLPAVFDGVVKGLGLTAALGLLGAMREVAGKGTLLAGIEKVLGPESASYAVQVLPSWYNFLLIALPPGAFICLGLLLALRNRLSRI